MGPNMDYCKWENTYRALQQCFSGDITSESEQRYAENAINLVLSTMEAMGVIDGWDEDELNIWLSDANYDD